MNILYFDCFAGINGDTTRIAVEHEVPLQDVYKA